MMNPVEAHYAQHGLLERVREALRESGLDPDNLAQPQLAKLDHFHVGGIDATDNLARLAEIQETDRVLDIGSGIGGPSRYLAANIGCQVSGLDLTYEYCQVAEMLARSTSLDHRVDYQQGDALHAPFEDATFDVVWTQHASMNIEDKPGLYREIFRLLKPGGRLAIHDVMAGTGEVRYPVPWARGADLSFLISGQTLQDILIAEGFISLVTQDVTKQGMEALQQVARSATSPGFGINTLLGPEFPVMAANLIANLQSGACHVMQAVAVKK
jgi:ubiquinone/menaquinone biosynthesis C-methylase UbiE